MLGTVVRAGDVLDLFSPERPDWGVTEVAAVMNLPKSSAHELLSSLAAIGLLQRTSSSRYALGWRVLRLSHNVVVSAGLARAAFADLRALRRRLGGPVEIAARDDEGILTLGRLEGDSGAPGMLTGVGERAQSCDTALGRVMLAHPAPNGGAPHAWCGCQGSPEPEIPGDNGLLAELEEIRQRGYAIRAPRAAADLGYVAAPIQDGRAVVVAAVSIGAPADRYRQRGADLRIAVTGTAERISRRLSDAG